MRKFYNAVRMLFDSSLIFSLSVITMAELYAMDAANTERLSNGQSLAYGEEQYNRVHREHTESIKSIVKG